MKYLSWLLKAALFFIVFAFALNNLNDVRVHFFFGHSWDAPLVLVVLTALILGLVAGVMLILPLWLKSRQQLKNTQNMTTPTSPTAEPTAQPPYGI